jgi:hypothetical protein
MTPCGQYLPAPSIHISIRHKKATADMTSSRGHQVHPVRAARLRTAFCDHMRHASPKLRIFQNPEFI